ncbi:MAG: glycerol-3-phosphate responsive antiterminator [Candidatus Izemoplasma sp.]
MIFEGQQRLPALFNFNMIKAFLKTDIKYCILVDFQLAEIGSIISDLKSHNRKVLVHIDMIKGLSADEYGAIHLIQNHRVDGIISIKPKVIAICKKRNVIGMQRVFLKDSISLSRSIQILSKSKPDCLEILPALSTGVIQYIKDKLQCDVFCGGLISSETQVQDCLSAGASGITVSKQTLWKQP